MKRILFSVVFLTFFFSCSSDDENPIQTQPESNFYALTVGNSWTYKNYKYDNITETYEDTGVVDHISIVGTETVAGELYYKFRRLTTGNENNITFCNPNGEHFELWRDSSGNLVNERGDIKFTNNDLSERILQENSWGNIYEILTPEETTISVEAGDFTCVNSERFARNSDNEQLPGLDKFYYADGFGLIYDTSSFVSSDIPVIKRRLESYVIQ